MDNKVKSVWTKKWKGLPANLIWFLLLFGATFLAICLPDLAIHPSTPLLNVIGLALVTSLGVSLAVIALLLGIRWLCRWRNLRRVLFAGVCLATLIVLFLTEENWRGRHAWENYKKESESKGESFSTSALTPPAVPDAQNFALAPLLKPALDLERTPKGIRWSDTNGYAHLIGISVTKSMHGSKSHAPDMGSLESGHLTDLAVWADFYHGNTNYPQPAASGTAAADVLRALSGFDADVEELRDAAATRPYSRFPIDYDHEPAAEILLPHLSNVKNLARLVNLRSICELASGETDAAFTDLKLGLRLSDSISNEPLLIDHLVRDSTLYMSLQSIREGMARRAWSESQLAEIENYLGTLNLLAEFKQGLRGERAMCVSGLDYLRRTGSFNPDFTPGNAGLATRKMISTTLGGLFFQNMLSLSRLFDDYTFASFDEKALRVYPDFTTESMKEMEILSKHRFSHPYKIYAMIMIPAVSNIADKSGRDQSWVEGAQVACALERYYLAEKTYPDSLEALIPQFIDAIPHDVIDGQPLRYHKIPGGYVIYSIGWNKTDDNGTVGLKPDGKGADATQGDWVWSSLSL